PDRNCRRSRGAVHNRRRGVAGSGRTRRAVSARARGSEIARCRSERDRSARAFRRKRRAGRRRSGSRACNPHAGAAASGRAGGEQQFLPRPAREQRAASGPHHAGRCTAGRRSGLGGDADRRRRGAHRHCGGARRHRQIAGHGKTAGRRVGRESAGAQHRHRGEPKTCRRRARGAQQAESAMIRVVVFLIVVGVLALGAAWLADRPGDVVVTWQGFRAETSLMVMAAALLAALAVFAILWSIIRAIVRSPAVGVWAILWSIIRAIVRSPAVLANRRRERRGARAYAAISHGLIAVGSGDIDAARKLSADANRRAPGEPLALLLSAQ